MCRLRPGREWIDSRASDIPVAEGRRAEPFADLDDGAETGDKPASPAPGGDPNPPDHGAPMVEFALDYARRGWPVFPCKPTNKAPFSRAGFNAATTDEETIRNWWGHWPKSHDRRADGIAIRRVGGRP